MLRLSARRSQRQQRRWRDLLGNSKHSHIGFVFVATSLLAFWDPWSAGPAHNLRRAEKVLKQSALNSFRKELPHKWHSATDSILQPVKKLLPDPSKPTQLAAFRRDFALPESGFVQDDDIDFRSPYRQWSRWLREVCGVLGLSLDEPDDADRVVVHTRQVMEMVQCPELWIDEAWPPSPLTPPSKSFNMPVWSVAPSQAGRSLLVIQAKLFRGFPSSEAKALIGYELGRRIWTRLELLPDEVQKHVLQAYVGARLYGTWQHAVELETSINSHRLQQFFAPRASRRKASGSASAGLLSALRGPGGPSDELAALTAAMNRLVPSILQPFVDGLLTGQRDKERISKRRLFGTRPRHESIRRTTLAERVGPWVQVAGEVGALHLLTMLQGTRGRAMVVTLDRVAALAAGDARAAAAALLRTRGLLPEGTTTLEGKQLDDVLDACAARALHHASAWRREALMHNAKQPRPETRVHELLTWAETDAGQRLLALAEIRRRSSVGVSLLPHFSDRCRHVIAFFSNHLSALLLLGLLASMPLLTYIDAVRWASTCTLALTFLGIMAGLGYGVDLTWPLRGVLLASLPLYSCCVGGVWWNHLLGGSRKWVQLSAGLAEELSEQADITAGIAYLARGWSEMARRSTATLDQELCGSWRTSLSEVAHKLNDLSTVVAVVPANSEFYNRGALSEKGDRQGSRVAQAGAQSSHRDDSGGALDLANVSRGSSQDAPLWKKVDHAVQRAAQIEAARMRRALDATDPEVMQNMMTWWMTDDTFAAPGSPTGAHLFQAVGSFAESDTLKALLLRNELHQRFQYPSFCTGSEASLGMSSPEVPAAASQDAEFHNDEFQRLEYAFALNFQALQELRTRIAPLANAKSALCGSWADVQGLCNRFKRLFRRPSTLKGIKAYSGVSVAAVADERKDERAEFRTLSCMVLATLAGILGAAIGAQSHSWGWLLGSFWFSVANAALLLNYSRLHLPYVRRRLDQRLLELSQQRDSLVREAQAAQRSSQQAGLIHMKACIFLQSVNVLRNINYLALCIKTEVQKANCEGSRQHSQNIATCGLQLLLALLPHTDPRWREDALSYEDCASVTALLYGQHTGRTRFLQKGIAEAQRRLWILFRMVNWSSAIPEEVQGQLTPLIDGYLRPVIVERRVPLGIKPGPMQQGADAAWPKALTQGGVRHDPMLDEAVHVNATESKPSRILGRALAAAELSRRQGANWGGRSMAHEDDRFSGTSASSTQPEWSSCDESQTLRRLVATREDVAHVLGRIAPAALVMPSHSPQTENILNDIFRSIVCSVELPSNSRSCSTGIGVAIGYSFGNSSYSFDGLDTALLVHVLTLLPDDANTTKEVPLKLTSILSDEPKTSDLRKAWSNVISAMPARFGETSLKVRRRMLKRAKDVLRSMACT